MDHIRKRVTVLCHVPLTAKRTANLTALRCRYLCQETKITPIVNAVSTALRSGKLECLKILLESQPTGGTLGSNSDEQTIYWSRVNVLKAAEAGFAECVDYAVAHGCPFDPKVCGADIHTHTFSHLACLFCVHMVASSKAYFSTTRWNVLCMCTLLLKVRKVESSRYFVWIIFLSELAISAMHEPETGPFHAAQAPLDPADLDSGL